MLSTKFPLVEKSEEGDDENERNFQELHNIIKKDVGCRRQKSEKKFGCLKKIWDDDDVSAGVSLLK
jgi:hypothetical protein